MQPGWQVLVHATPLTRPMLEEVIRLIARAGAYPLVRLGYIDSEQVPFDSLWASEAPFELLAEMAPSEARMREEVDAQILIWGPENTRAATLLAPDRRAELRKAYTAWNERRLSGEMRWNGCLYPTDALAQDAGMTLAAYTDFVFGATLSTGTPRARGCAATPTDSTRPRGTDRRRRHRPDVLARRPRGSRRRRPLQHAGRRVLLLAPSRTPPRA